MLCLLVFFAACETENLQEEAEAIGYEAPPDRNQDASDELIGRFLREIGPEATAVLLRSPYHPTNPGLPVDQLLTLVVALPTERLISLVRGVGAETVLSLVNGIKRLGCNRPTDDQPNGAFNIPSEHHYSECSTENFDHLSRLVTLVNGVNDLEVLIELINRTQYALDTGLTEADLADSQDIYLERLNFLVAYLDNTQQLVDVVNEVSDSSRLILLVSSLDEDITPPVPTVDIVNQRQLVQLNKLVTIVEEVDSTPRLSYLVEYGTTTNIISLLESVEQDSVSKVSSLINDVEGPSAPTAMEDFEDYTQRAQATGIGKLINLINYTYDLDACEPRLDQVATILNQVKDGRQLGILINLVLNTNNLIGLVNNVIQQDPVADAEVGDLINLLNLLERDDLPKLAEILNEIGEAELHTDCGLSLAQGNDNHVLVGQLLASENGLNGGIGFANLGEMVQQLETTEEAERLAGILNEVAYYEAPDDIYDGMLTYNSPTPNLTRREAFVRLLSETSDTGLTLEADSASNPLGTSVDFPGLGLTHLSGVIVPSVSRFNQLVDMLNTLNLTDAVIIIGCQDQVTAPDFKTPCCQIGQWPEDAACE